MTSTSLKELAQQFQKVGIENSWRELRHLMAFITGESYEAYFFGTASDLNTAQHNQLRELANRRLTGEPLSKIVEKREFWGLNFKVTKDTLDPRADSETLVQAVTNTFSDQTQSLKIVDFGTGTGCLLISLLKEYPNALGVAIDKSEAALNIAKENARYLGVDKRMTFCLSNWAESLDGLFDVIISNPPYIGIHESLEANVKNYDPVSALFAGEDGLDAYRALLGQIGKLCHPNTKIFFEIGQGQKAAVQEIASQHKFVLVDVYKDLAGIERVLQLRIV